MLDTLRVYVRGVNVGSFKPLGPPVAEISRAAFTRRKWNLQNGWHVDFDERQGEFSLAFEGSVPRLVQGHNVCPLDLEGALHGIDRVEALVSDVIGHCPALQLSRLDLLSDFLLPAAQASLVIGKSYKAWLRKSRETIHLTLSEGATLTISGRSYKMSLYDKHAEVLKSRPWRECNYSEAALLSLSSGRLRFEERVNRQILTKGRLKNVSTVNQLRGFLELDYDKHMAPRRDRIQTFIDAPEDPARQVRAQLLQTYASMRGGDKRVRQLTDSYVALHKFGVEDYMSLHGLSREQMKELAEVFERAGVQAILM